MKTIEEKDFHLDAQQNRALELVLAGKNVFVHGKSGTGKSVLVRAIERLCPGSVVLLAPTEAAAREIGGESLARFIFPAAGETLDSLHAKFRAVETIVIDDVDMLRPDFLQALDCKLRAVATDELSVMPFGGKQFVAIGDFFQPAPVIKGPDADWYVQNTYCGAYAFVAPAWEVAQFEVVELDRTYRYGSPKDVEILDAIRVGGVRRSVMVYAKDWDDEWYATGSYINNLDRLNKRCGKHGVKDPDPMAVRVHATRAEVEDINDWEMWVDETLGVTLHFNGQVSGTFSRDALPTSEHLTLRIGCAVTILADDPAGRYVQGEAGTLFDHCGSALKLRLRGGREVEMTAKEWFSHEYELVDGRDGTPTLRKRVCGSFKQYPLAAGRSITLDDARWLTLPYAYVVPASDDGFSAGQLYSAISRTPNLDNLVLDRQLKPNASCADGQVLEFYHKLASHQTSAD